ncbi:MAG TPA: pseudaminic acid cytidylyltransferase [Cellvibrionaceae bacterium]|nr:pseudaminic acid cytidylyltransferase [Cellvibrionaceae bacterium]HMW72802.1 pseudaminic acid cytidylyltransferase [Cellvibrionaceae bacterium]HNG61391.1 pseudaminic acid cytidylyltransferase [Cellvibrionaceae bacterium]
MRVAVIPARGGSKRIPRKNIKPFLGQPIIHYAIKAALESELFDLVLCSTDDAEIAQVAIGAGAQVPFVRPADIADDHAITADVIAHAISFLQSNGQPVESVCCLYATAAFVTAEQLQQACTVFERERCDFVFSATAFDFPIQRAIYLTAEGRVEMFYPEYALTRSQDLTPAFHDAGQFYWGSATAWLEKRRIFSPNSAAFIVPSHEVQDIDTLEDWRRAELLYQLRQQLLCTASSA